MRRSPSVDLEQETSVLLLKLPSLELEILQPRIALSRVMCARHHTQSRRN